MRFQMRECFVRRLTENNTVRVNGWHRLRCTTTSPNVRIIYCVFFSWMIWLPVYELAMIVSSVCFWSAVVDWSSELAKKSIVMTHLFGFLLFGRNDILRLHHPGQRDYPISLSLSRSFFSPRVLVTTTRTRIYVSALARLGCSVCSRK